MSFFGKLKSSATPASPAIGTAQKKDPSAPVPTPLEKHLADIGGPVRPDGSDKFFGFENYGSTCYCNSIIQCLYYSAPFREKVINFPPLPNPNPRALPRLDTGVAPGLHNANYLKSPALPGPQTSTSPARRPIVLPGTPEAQNQKPDEKDSPEYKKKIAMQTGPILDMQLNNSASYGMDESLFTSLKDIFESIIGHQSRMGVVSPHKFLEVLKRDNEMFRSAMHQDAHEFLNLLLNSVVQNVEEYSNSNPSSPPNPINGSANGNATIDMATAMAEVAKASAAIEPENTAWVHDLFEGMLTSETRCLTCENTTRREETFMDLSVDLEAHSSVTNCLRKFSQEEMMCQRNKFQCDNCGGLQEAEKRMKIKRLPRILALHLKRFEYTEDYGRLQKLFHRVVYPYHLRLFNTADEAEDPDRLYELYAVVVHIGSGPYHGHYVSIIKTQDRGWLMFDDELVEPVSKDFVRNFFGGEEPKGPHLDNKHLACAYVLFYQETTLEAVQREMEAEGQAAAAAATDNFEPASPTTPGGFYGNGLRGTHTAETPMREDVEPQFAGLAHAATAPTTSLPSRSVTNGSTTSPFMPASTTFGRSLKKEDSAKGDKKATKQAEKDRKAQLKEEEKAYRLKQKELAEARRERWKKQDEELKAALEASKLTKEEEDKRAPPAAAGAARETTTPSSSLPNDGGDKVSGLNRFRHSSMSLRQKPKFWSSGGNKEMKDNMGVLPSPAEHANDGASQTGGAGGGDLSGSKRNRFSLGRKKSTAY